jgi:hypothetical protein
MEIIYYWLVCGLVTVISLSVIDFLGWKVVETYI